MLLPRLERCLARQKKTRAPAGVKRARWYRGIIPSRDGVVVYIYISYYIVFFKEN